MILNSKWALLTFFTLFRFLNAIFIKTYFDPDEYWQSIEIAHSMIFGYGFVTWEWVAQIRSSLYILPFLLVFQIVKSFNLGDLGIIYGPKLIQSIIAASLDLVTVELSRKITFSLHGNSSHSLVNHVIFINMINWFNCLYYPRTISNVLEALIINSSLLYWPIIDNDDGEKKNNNESGKSSDKKNEINSFNHSFSTLKAIILAGLSIYVRPSAITFWIFPFLELFLRSSCIQRIKFTVNIFILAIPIIIFGIILDSYFYRILYSSLSPSFFLSSFHLPFQSLSSSGWMIVVSWWNFIKINLIDGVSEEFGVNPWHFHLFQTIPVLLGAFIPFFFYGLFELISQFSLFQFALLSSKSSQSKGKIIKIEKNDSISEDSNNRSINSDSWKSLKWILGYLASGIFFNSLISHKEFRFLIPIQPVLIIISALGLKRFNEKGFRMKSKENENENKAKDDSSSIFSMEKKRKRGNILNYFLILINLMAIIFFSRFHQSAPIHMIDKIRQITTENDDQRRIFLQKYEMINGKRKPFDYNEFENNQSIIIKDGNFDSFLFLMPCHSTPGYGLFHRENAILRFLDCKFDSWKVKNDNEMKRDIKEKELNNMNQKGENIEFNSLKGMKCNEKCQFYQDPISFLSKRVFSDLKWKQKSLFIILYDCLFREYADLKEFLASKGYYQEYSVWNGPFPTDDRAHGNMILMKRKL